MIIAAIILLVVLALMGAPLFAIILGAAALGFIPWKSSWRSCTSTSISSVIPSC